MLTPRTLLTTTLRTLLLVLSLSSISCGSDPMLSTRRNIERMAAGEVRWGDKFQVTFDAPAGPPGLLTVRAPNPLVYLLDVPRVWAVHAEVQFPASWSFATQSLLCTLRMTTAVGSASFTHFIDLRVDASAPPPPDRLLGNVFEVTVPVVVAQSITIEFDNKQFITGNTGGAKTSQTLQISAAAVPYNRERDDL